MRETRAARTSAVKRRRAGRVRLSVLCADLRGLTRLATRLESEALTGLLRELFSAMTDVAVAHRAVIDRVSSDAFVLLFGLPRPRRDDAVRALRTALDLQRAVLGLRNRWVRDGRALAAELCVGIGVASGEVVMARVEAGTMPYTLVGEPLERAQRLAAAAPQGDIAADALTHGTAQAALDGEVVFSACEPAHHAAEPLSAYRVRRRRAGLRAVGRD